MDTLLPVMLDVLEHVDGPAPVPLSRDGWELVLLENVAYLVDDAVRLEAFGRLRSLVGLTPEAISAADPLRVLFRLGYGEPARSYDGMYRRVQQAHGRRPIADPFAT